MCAAKQPVLFCAFVVADTEVRNIAFGSDPPARGIVYDISVGRLAPACDAADLHEVGLVACPFIVCPA